MNLSLLLAVLLATQPAPPQPAPTPYADLAARPYQYLGPSSDQPAHDLAEIRIGLFAPTRGRWGEAGRSLLRGVELALQEANQDGGFHGTPFALVHRSADQVWGSARLMVELAYNEQVWAVIGGVGGEATHVAEQVVTKARVPLVSTAASDASLTEINIPWMFRLMPDDHHSATVMAVHLTSLGGSGQVVALGATSYDERLRRAAFVKLAPRHGLSLLLDLDFAAGAADLSPQLALVTRAKAEAVVLWAGPEDAARCIVAIRRQRPDLHIVCGQGALSPALLERAGRAAEGVVVVAPAWLDPADPAVTSFRTAFVSRWRAPPDLTAAQAYDGAWLVVRAIRSAGLDRVRIRTALTNASFDGISGTIHFDGTGASTREPVLMVVRNGRFQLLRTAQPPA